MSENTTASQFIEKLETFLLLKNRTKAQNSEVEADKFAGVRTRQIFDLAREFIKMPIDQIEDLLENPSHTVRVGALSIMDKQARLNSQKTPEDRRKALFDLYLRHPDRIDNWDLVDLGSPFVIGGYLLGFDKPRDILYQLAHSKNTWERRTAIVSTLYFVRHNQVEDTFKIAEILIYDDQDLVQKAVGGLLREAGKKDRPQLLSFLDRYAATMPRVMLRYAIEHLDTAQREYYMNSKRSKSNIKQA